MTGIQWTDETWNPTTGCDRVSSGCDRCYALAMAGRLKGMGQPKYQRDGDPKTSGPGFGLTTHSDALDLPLRWRSPRMVFVNSMSDLFHEKVPDDFIASMFGVMARAPRHTFQVLTKRHARMRSLLSNPDWVWSVQVDALRHGFNPDGVELNPQDITWPLPNVWLGVSVEDQKWADIRIPVLLRTPAVVRFLSCEPLLGPLNLWHWIDPSDPCVDCDRCGEECFPDEIGVGHILIGGDKWCEGPGKGALPHRIDWVIAGGESGPGARPMHPAWAREIRDHCTAASVPFFFKQRGAWTWETRSYEEPDTYVSEDGRVADEETALADGGDWKGMWRVGKKLAGRELDGRTWDEFPVAAKAAA